jgi:hypothetical protein
MRAKQTEKGNREMEKQRDTETYKRKERQRKADTKTDEGTETTKQKLRSRGDREIQRKGEAVR